MWVEVKKAQTLTIAEMWKEAFEGEGIPARIMPVSGLPMGREIEEYSIMIPRDKQHVVKDVLRKL
jgi:hypothetical protein